MSKNKFENYLKHMFLKFLIFLKRNLYTVILFNVILIIISPWLFTRKWNFLDFTHTGEIGDTLGGITSPFINVLNAILIFLAFKEQKNANDILRNQNKREKEKEMEKLNDIKELIVYDLEFRIKPIAKVITPEIQKTLEELESDKIKYVGDYVDFNDSIFRSNELHEYKRIFNKDIKDLKNVINIYNRVSFIYKHTPLQISFKYPTDTNSMKFLNVAPDEKALIIKRHIDKKRIELEQLIVNINGLLELIEEIIIKYK